MNLLMAERLGTERVVRRKAPEQLFAEDRSELFAAERSNAEEFEPAIKAHLRVLLLPRIQPTALALLKGEAWEGEPPGWDVEGENVFLRAVAAGCGLGLCTFDTRLHQTAICQDFALLLEEENRDWPGGVELDRLVAWWIGDTRQTPANRQVAVRRFHCGYLRLFGPAWKTLRTDTGRVLLRRWISEPVGWSHQALQLAAVEHGISEAVAFECLSAAVLVGAMSFNGRKWKPGLFAAAIAYRMD